MVCNTKANKIVFYVQIKAPDTTHCYLHHETCCFGIPNNTSNTPLSLQEETAIKLFTF